MPAWFSKLFKPEETGPGSVEKTTEPDRSPALMYGKAAEPPRPAMTRPSFLSEEEDTKSDFAPRRVVDPPVLMDDEPATAGSGEIRIKAQMDRDGRTTLFMVDRPVLERYSAWFPIAQAASESPLAQALFAVDGVESVLIHGMNVTVARDPFRRTDWEAWAKEIGATLRGYLQSGEPVVTSEFLRSIPSEDEISRRIQDVLDLEINPGIASHSGAIVLERVEGNTVHIRMMGGCQGCAASTITLRQGVHQAFREAVPSLGAILDQTDHSAGTNPYYRQLPTGMNTDG